MTGVTVKRSDERRARIVACVEALRQYVNEDIPRTEMAIGRRMWGAEAIGHIALLLVDALLVAKDEYQ